MHTWILPTSDVRAKTAKIKPVAATQTLRPHGFRSAHNKRIFMLVISKTLAETSSDENHFRFLSNTQPSAAVLLPFFFFFFSSRTFFVCFSLLLARAELWCGRACVLARYADQWLCWKKCGSRVAVYRPRAVTTARRYGPVAVSWGQAGRS